MRLNIAAFAGGFATFINMWCTQALLPVLAAAFHVSEARTGLTVTAPLVATAVAAPVVGLISDRFGRKKFIGQRRRPSEPCTLSGRCVMASESIVFGTGIRTWA